MRICEILVTRNSGLIRAGFFLFDGQKVLAEPSPGFREMFDSIMEEPTASDVTIQSDSLKWFDSLPSMYHGSYLKARLHNTNSLSLIKGGEFVATIKFEPELDIDTKDDQLEDLFYELVDEGLPDGEEVNLTNVGELIETLGEYGYEVTYAP